MSYSKYLFLPFLLSACQGVTAQQNAPEAQALLASEARGAVHYEALCASCHGSDLKGGQAGSLVDDIWMYGSTDANIITVINKGIEQAGMPGFGDVLLSSDQKDILAFVRAGSSLATRPPIVDVPSVQDQVKVDLWVDGLDEPWGFVFTGAQDAIVTEKKGNLRQIKDGQLLPDAVDGIPEVVSAGQGGLLDVALGPDYADEGWVYLAYSDPGEDGSAMTKIIRGKIKDGVWTQQQTLFQAKPEHYIKTRFHYGSRITFDAFGHLYFSIGDRGKMDDAQNITRPNGKIHRIKRGGEIPDDNPFVSNPDAYGSIYSYGNRNAQGLIIHPDTGVLWETEHGPKGGDELNAIKAGVNYGWPVISYGRNYNGTELTPYQAKLGMAQPASQWTPSIAVCGLDVYTGDLFEAWRGRLLVGSLRDESIRLVDVRGDQYVSEVILIKGEGRVRDVTTGPDGAIYAALPDRIVRISPTSN